MKNRESLFGWALLAYFLFVACLITLFPFRFHWPVRVEVLVWAEWLDVVLNIIFFLPLGFLFRLTQQKEIGKERVRVLIYGLLASLFIESVQVFQIERYSSPSDIMANGLGAWVGAFLFDRVKNHLNKQMAGRLALELPLMSLFYLLGPMLWLNGLATGKETSHLFLAPIIGLYGACILASVWFYALKPQGVISADQLAVITGVWFLGASLPGVIKNPLFIFSSGIGLAVFVRILIFALQKIEHKERRFEITTLRRIWPIYAVYLSLLTFWPWRWPDRLWKGAIGFAGVHGSTILILRLLEYVLVFTFLGYMVAEVRGRKKETFFITMMWVFLACFASGCLLELIRGFHPKHTASLAQLIISTGVGMYGGLLYRLQLTAVRRLIKRDGL
ncbi:MAG: VanZ family protein [Candidatus Scalindua sp.]|nr:VanZ family protein [Candidatus Scalindua sp.]